MMLGIVPMVGAVAILGLAPPGDTPAGRRAADIGETLPGWRVADIVRDLDVRLRLDDPGSHLVPVGSVAREGDSPAPCVADVCQARVDVPGFAAKFGKPHRSELVASLLTRAGVEPIASIAWVFAASGLRVDWSPPTYDGGDPGAAHGGGWGTAFVRLKFRIDARNLPVLPDRAHVTRHRWTEIIAPRA